MMSSRNLSSGNLGFIALILGFGAVHVLKPVLLPLVIALFMIAMVWPIQTWLTERLPKRISYILSYVALIAILSAFGGLFYLAIAEFTQHLPKYQQPAEELLRYARSLIESYNLPAPDQIQPDQLQSAVSPLVATFYATLGHVALITALVILGLPELVFWEDKLGRCFDQSNGSRWLKAAGQATHSFQKYISVMTLIGLFTGALTTAFCWAVGLDFALLWGLMAFVVNFVPVLGAMVMLIPPTLTAVVQFSDPTQVWLVLGGVGAIQFFTGNIIDPMFQGKSLSMSPVVILISIAFWTLLWGIPGAFLGVPLTHIFMVTCQQFPATQPIACLLSNVRKSTEE